MPTATTILGIPERTGSWLSSRRYRTPSVAKRIAAAVQSPRPEGARNTYAVRVEELHPLARDEWSIHATGASDHRRRILSRHGEHPHQKKERAAKTHP